MTIGKLKTRWEDNHNSMPVLKTIKELCVNGGELKQEYSPFEVLSNGYADFRGINMSNTKIVKTKFEKSDFSFTDFGSAWIEQSLFKEIIFDKTDFSDVSEHE
jgi:uncharacterized protein YjbI with pentapeptide repeats